MYKSPLKCDKYQDLRSFLNSFCKYLNLTVPAVVEQENFPVAELYEGFEQQVYQDLQRLLIALEACYDKLIRVKKTFICTDYSEEHIKKLFSLLADYENEPDQWMGTLYNIVYIVSFSSATRKQQNAVVEKLSDRLSQEMYDSELGALFLMVLCRMFWMSNKDYFLLNQLLGLFCRAQPIISFRHHLQTELLQRGILAAQVETIGDDYCEDYLRLYVWLNDSEQKMLLREKIKNLCSGKKLGIRELIEFWTKAFELLKEDDRVEIIAQVRIRLEKMSTQELLDHSYTGCSEVQDYVEYLVEERIQDEMRREPKRINILTAILSYYIVVNNQVVGESFRSFMKDYFSSTSFESSDRIALMQFHKIVLSHVQNSELVETSREGVELRQLEKLIQKQIKSVSSFSEVFGSWLCGVLDDLISVFPSPLSTVLRAVLLPSSNQSSLNNARSSNTDSSLKAVETKEDKEPAKPSEATENKQSDSGGDEKP